MEGVPAKHSGVPGVAPVDMQGPTPMLPSISEEDSDKTRREKLKQHLVNSTQPMFTRPQAIRSHEQHGEKVEYGREAAKLYESG